MICIQTFIVGCCVRDGCRDGGQKRKELDLSRSHRSRRRCSLGMQHTLSHVVKLRTPGRRGLKQRWWTTKRRHSELRPKQPDDLTVATIRKRILWPNRHPFSQASQLHLSPECWTCLWPICRALLTEPTDEQDSNIGGEDDQNNDGGEDFNHVASTPGHELPEAPFTSTRQN